MFCFEICLFLLSSTIVVSYCDVYPFMECDGTDVSQNCEVNEMRVNPCPLRSEDSRCKFSRGSSSTIEVDFTPGFVSNSLNANIYWFGIAFGGMKTNGCESTSCPTKAGMQQTYSYDTKIETYLKGKFTLKFILKGDSEDQKCCIKFRVHAV